MAKKNIAWALGGLLVLAGYAAPVLADDDFECEPVAGTVMLTPDADGSACKSLQKAFRKTVFLCSYFPNTAFTVAIDGDLTGDGYAGFTFLMPLPVPPGAQSFTAHTVLEFDDGRLFTTDAGMVMANGNSIEELTIIGGSGAYAEASGTLRAFGNLLGGTGQYIGELCLPEED